jgi:hypothetical protein
MADEEAIRRKHDLLATAIPNRGGPSSSGRAATSQNALRRNAVGAPLRSCAISTTRRRPDHQTDVCDSHASELCAALRVIDRRR